MTFTKKIYTSILSACLLFSISYNASAGGHCSTLPGNTGSICVAMSYTGGSAAANGTGSYNSSIYYEPSIGIDYRDGGGQWHTWPIQRSWSQPLNLTTTLKSATSTTLSKNVAKAASACFYLKKKQGGATSKICSGIAYP
jgi:hypothetical protein